MPDHNHEASSAILETSSPDAGGAAWRFSFLLWALAAATLCGLLLSPKLWLSSRTYPLAPVWDGLPAVPHPLDWLWFGALIALLGASVASPRPSRPTLSFVALAGLLSLWDQTRWQPWFYQYLFMFAVLGFASRRRGDPQLQQAGLDGCRLIVASMYVWSGLQKVNVSFVTTIHPYLMEPVLPWLPESWGALANEAGWLVPFLETGIGLGLLAWPLYYPAVFLALGMHAFILLVLGPWGYNWNTVVWPWNLAMMLFVVILFWRRRPRAPLRVFWPRRLWITRVTLLLFGVMPLFNFFGSWDAYLSAALYSGNTMDASVYVDVAVWNTLPSSVQERYTRQGSEEEDPSMPPYRVSLFTWAIEELNVPDYPARRVYRSLCRALARRARSADGVVLIVEEPPDWLTGQRAKTREPLGLEEDHAPDPPVGDDNP